MSVFFFPLSSICVLNQLAGLGSGIRQNQAIYNIIKTSLKQYQQIFAGDTGFSLGFCEYTPELSLQNTITVTHLLLFTQLFTAVRKTSATPKLRTGGFGTPVQSALGNTFTAFKH
jgi:S-adenosylmethionine synthetase